MFAIADIKGFQERVSVGDKLNVPLVDAEAGKNVSFGNVLLLSGENGDVKIGTPFIAGAKVEAKVIENSRADKIRVYKMRRRKRYRRTRGHRQGFSKIEIINIVG